MEKVWIRSIPKGVRGYSTPEFKIWWEFVHEQHVEGRIDLLAPLFEQDEEVVAEDPPTVEDTSLQISKGNKRGNADLSNGGDSSSSEVGVIGRGQRMTHDLCRKCLLALRKIILNWWRNVLRLPIQENMNVTSVREPRREIADITSN